MPPPSSQESYLFNPPVKIKTQSEGLLGMTLPKRREIYIYLKFEEQHCIQMFALTANNGYILFLPFSSSMQTPN